MTPGVNSTAGCPDRRRPASACTRRLGALGLLLLLVLAWFPARAEAAYPAEAGDFQQSLDLKDRLAILEDRTGKLTIENVRKPEFSSLFRSYSDSGLAGTLSDSVYWVRIRLHNGSPYAKNLLLELSKPQLSEVTLYQFENGRLIQKAHTGHALPFGEREILHRNFVFQLVFPPSAEQELYMRVHTDTYLQLPMKLWEVQSFVEREQNVNLILGAYYGIMLIMALYHVFLYFSIRDRTYLYYMMFILSFAGLQLVWDGLAYAYLWPNAPAWELKSNPVFIVLTTLAALLFTSSFLSVARHSPRMGRIMKGVSAGMMACLASFPLLSAAASTRIAVYAATAGLLTCIAGVFAVRLRSRTVLYYSLAWAALFAGAILNILAAFKLLPLNFWSLYGIRLGSVAETMLLSLALADRFNLLRSEKRLEERQAVMLKALHRATRTLTSTHNIDQQLSLALTSLSRVTGCESGWILLEEEEAYVPKAAVGSGGGVWNKHEEGGLEDDPFYARLLAERTVLWTDGSLVPCGTGPGVRTCIGIPVMYHGRVLALIVLYSIGYRTISQEECRILSDFSSQVAVSIENARLFGEINRMATTDGLTGVYNRTYFLKLAERHFDRSQGSDYPLSVIMVDIDHFKSINDHYGHQAGDRVIQEVVYRLRKLLHSRGLIGRYGGEEFIVLLPGVRADRALRLAEAMREQLELTPVELEADEQTITISLGVASSDRSVHSLTELINKADQALYDAKENGRNRVRAYGSKRSV
ncbi:diguanylate cyclase [Paenibacillus spiritus]|uniref:Diguanylate cyclase n=1 Tax=Paenibacillus spiritus TaxID=2496557 RepID=A0A5J5G573_9BACL|nr:diguanylate cyclase [Paenibacillus spiritus]KAA9002420.1 diguanylate cyclase [Paenibacillus spiritus]